MLFFVGFFSELTLMMLHTPAAMDSDMSDAPSYLAPFPSSSPSPHRTHPSHLARQFIWNNVA